MATDKIRIRNVNIINQTNEVDGAPVDNEDNFTGKCTLYNIHDVSSDIHLRTDPTRIDNVR